MLAILGLMDEISNNKDLSIDSLNLKSYYPELDLILDHYHLYQLDCMQKDTTVSQRPAPVFHFPFG